jgi:hypothetical protein
MHRELVWAKQNIVLGRLSGGGGDVVDIPFLGNSFHHGFEAL